MNKRLIPVLALALAVSGLATFVVYRMLAAKLTAQAQPAAQTQIVLASKDLQLGALISEGDVRLADWSGPTPKGTATTIESALNRGVITAIYEGEPVVETRLAPRGAGAGMAATIPVGMRAVAVRVNEVVGVAGFVVPGMRVDVLVSGNPPNAGSAGTMTRTVLQNIEVLSAGQKIEKNAQGTPESVSVVNLLVTPEQAETLSLASNQTQIQLVLRNPLDTKETKTPGTATANLFSGVPLKPAVAAQPRAPRPPRPEPIAAVKPPVVAPEKPIVPVIVEVFHGSTKARAQFQGIAEEKN